MLDIKYIKENPEEVIARLQIKGKDARESEGNLKAVLGRSESGVEDLGENIGFEISLVFECGSKQGNLIQPRHLHFTYLGAPLLFGEVVERIVPIFAFFGIVMSEFKPGSRYRLCEYRLHFYPFLSPNYAAS